MRASAFGMSGPADFSIAAALLYRTSVTPSLRGRSGAENIGKSFRSGAFRVIVVVERWPSVAMANAILKQ